MATVLKIGDVAEMPHAVPELDCPQTAATNDHHDVTYLQGAGRGDFFSGELDGY
jgi:hypothetical protein